MYILCNFTRPYYEFLIVLCTIVIYKFILDRFDMKIVGKHNF